MIYVFVFIFIAAIGTLIIRTNRRLSSVESRLNILQMKLEASAEQSMLTNIKLNQLVVKLFTKETETQ